MKVAAAVAVPAELGVEPVRYPADRRASWVVASGAGAAGTMSYAMFWLLSLFPAAAESAYGTGVGPYFAFLLSRVSGLVPFQLAGWLIAAYAAWLLTVATLGIREVLQRRRRLRNALGGGARRVVRDAGILTAVFYLVWGLNYARPTFPEQMGWPDWEGATPAELMALLVAASEARNLAYLDLHGSEDAGSPTPFPEDSRPLEAAVQEGWRRAATLLSLPPGVALPYGRVKWMHPNGLLARVGIMGMYNPFTGEANVFPGLPAVDRVAVMAHEQAHQRGYASEADASFVGFVAAALAPHPFSRYAAASFAYAEIWTALNQVARRELPRDVWRELVAEVRDQPVLPGVRRDVTHAADYYSGEWRQLQSERGSQVASELNDRYLSTNRIAGGTRDYSRSVQRLVTFARLNGGEMLPSWPAR